MDKITGSFFKFVQRLDTLRWMLMPLLAFVAMGSVMLYAGWNYIVNLPTWALLAGGAIILLLFVGGLVWTMRWMYRRRKAKLAAKAAVEGEKVVVAISEEDRALQKRLTERFEEGIARLEKHKRGLYSMPFYLVVGEPGCGKTEAIRRSGVGFPAGLTDANQGEGGTELLDWWFTNKAVLLDVPGRFFLNDQGTSDAGIWETLLKLLAKHRPGCPLNGVVLTIAADKLYVDTDEQLDVKTSKIVERLEAIARELGVHLPVFVVVTKCDRISGFSDYFGNLTDPADREQILGWSNPASVDAELNMDQVHKDAESIYGQLARRREALLKYSLESQSLGFKRSVHVSYLFEFPRSFRHVMGRLRVCLDKIFDKNVWFNEPFALRGFYFTSAMRRGTDFDYSLAQVMNAPVQNIPQGERPESDDAYFLRDVFLEKIFKEGGLVSWDQDLSWRRKRRRATVVALLTFAVALLTIYTFIEAGWWQRELARKNNFWRGINEWVNTTDTIVSQSGSSDYVYNGAIDVRLPGVPDANTTLARLPERISQWTDPIPTPFVFKPVDFFNVYKLNREVDKAYKNIFQTRYVLPVVLAAANRLTDQTKAWNDAGTAALGQLIRLHAFTEQKPPDQRASENVIQIDRLFEFILGFDSQFTGDKNLFAQYINAIYTPRTWPPSTLLYEHELGHRRAAIETGVERFREYVDTIVETGDAYADLRLLSSSLFGYRDAESVLWRNTERVTNREEPIESAHEIDVVVEGWREDVAKLEIRKEALDTAVNTLFKDETIDIKRLCRDETAVVVQRVNDAYHTLLRELANVELPDEAAKDPAWIAALRKKIESYNAAAIEKVNKVSEDFLSAFDELKADSEFFSMTEFRGMRQYQLRTFVYGFFDDSTFRPPSDSYDAFEYLFDLDEIQKEFDASVRKVAQFDTNTSTYGVGRAATEDILRLVFRRQRYLVVQRIVESLPITTDGFQALVAARVEGQWIDRPVIPLTERGLTERFDDRFNTEVVYDLLRLWDHIRTVLSNERRGKNSIPDLDSLARSFREKDRIFGHYLTEYLNYWTRVIDQNTEMVQHASWLEFRQRLDELDIYGINYGLKLLYETALYAVDIVPSNVDTQPESHAVLARKLSTLNADFDKACALVVDRWKAFRAIDRESVDTVLQMPATAFKEQYLSLLGDKASLPDFPFWTSLTYEAMRLFADEGEELSRFYLTNLAVNYKGFPLYADVAVPALSRVQVQEAAELVRYIKKRKADAGEAKASKAVNIMAGDRTGLPDIDRELDRLQGDVVLRNDFEREWFERLVTVLDFIAGDEPLECQMVVLNQEFQKVRPKTFPPVRPSENIYGYASWIYRYMRVNDVEMNTEPPASAGEFSAVLPLDISTDRLVLQMYYNMPDLKPGPDFLRRVNGVSSVELPWLPLAMLHLPDSRILENDKTVGIGPVGVVDQDQQYGNVNYYWLGFKFNKEIPPIDTWPSSFSWPILEAETEKKKAAARDSANPAPPIEVKQEAVPATLPPGPVMAPLPEVSPLPQPGSPQTSAAPPPPTATLAPQPVPAPLAAAPAPPADGKKKSEVAAAPAVSPAPAPPAPASTPVLASSGPRAAAPPPLHPLAPEEAVRIVRPASTPVIRDDVEAPPPPEPKPVREPVPAYTPTPPMPSAATVAQQLRMTSPSLSTPEEGPGVRVSKSVAQATPTNVLPLRFVIQFDEPVQDFHTGENSSSVAFSGTAQGLMYVVEGSGAEYTVTVTDVIQDGEVVLTVPEGICKDLFGNANKAATHLENVVVFDHTSPLASLNIPGTEATQATNQSPMELVVSFSEPVYGFEDSDLSLSNATLVRTAGADGDVSFSFDLIPLGEGSITAKLEAGLCADLVGNPNDASDLLIRLYDSAGPEILLTSAATPETTNKRVTRVRAIFSENVSDFESTDLVAVNGVVSNFRGAAGSKEYSFDLTATGEGEVSVEVPVGAVTDVLGNPNYSPAKFHRIFDTTRPTVSIESSTPEPAPEGPVPIKVIFSEPVFGFGDAELVVTNADKLRASGIDGDAAYVFQLTPTGGKKITAKVGADVALDAAGNGNKASQVFSRTVDAAGPSITFSAPDLTRDVTNRQTLKLVAALSEACSGLEMGDLEVVNGTISGFSASPDGRDASFFVSASREGLVSVSVPAGAAVDRSGNPSLAAGPFAWTYDATGPSVGISAPEGEVITSAPVPLQITFSEAVTGFERADLAAVNARVSNLSGSGAAYAVELMPLADGPVSLTVPAGAALDDLGNPNSEGKLTFTYSAGAPRIEITSALPDPLNAERIPVTVTFSKPVTGFEDASIAVSNAAFSRISGGAGSANYTFELVPSGEGTVTMRVGEGAAKDAAGMASLASETFRREVDRQAPSLELLPRGGSAEVTASPFLVTAKASEAVAPIRASHFVVSHGKIASVKEREAGLRYDLEVVAETPGELRIALPAGRLADLAGNTNVSESEWLFHYAPPRPDIPAPAVTQSAPAEPVHIVEAGEAAEGAEVETAAVETPPQPDSAEISGEMAVPLVAAAAVEVPAAPESGEASSSGEAGDDPAEGGGYVVYVGAFELKSNAEKRKRQVESKSGARVSIHQRESDNLFVLRAGPFASRGQARQFLDELRSKAGVTEGYIVQLARSSEAADEAPKSPNSI